MSTAQSSRPAFGERLSYATQSPETPTNVNCQCIGPLVIARRDALAFKT
jgi:hypothetical protein